MAKRKLTAISFKRPVAIAAAMAAGFFSGDANAQTTPQDEQPSSLQRLLSEREHRFSEVPLLKDRNQNGSLFQYQQNARPTAERPQSLPEKAKQIITGTTPQTNQVNAQTLLGEYKQVASADINRARVVFNSNENAPKADTSSWSAPRLKPASQAVQAVGNVPAYQQGQNIAQTSYQSVPKTPHSATGTHERQLRNLDMERFEQKIVDIFGEHLRAATSEDGRYVRVEIPASRGRKMTTLVDRQSGLLSYEGDPALVSDWHGLIAKVDMLPVRKTDGSIETTAVMYRSDEAADRLQQVVYLMTQPQDVQQPTPTPATALPGGQGAGGQDEQLIQIQGLKKPVRIVRAPDGSFTLIGDPADVAIVQRELERLAREKQANQPVPVGIDLENVRGAQIEERLQEIYDASYASIHGPVQIASVDNPNRLIVVGQANAIAAVRELVTKLDVASDAAPTDGFKTIALKHLSAADAQRRLQNFFVQTGVTGNDENSLPTSPVSVIADFRSNQLTIRGSRQLIAQAEAFLATIDVDGTEGTAEATIKRFQLRNTVAADLALVIQDAINGGQRNANQAFVPDGAGQQQQGQQQQQVEDNQSELKSNQLSLSTIGEDGRKVGGAIMFDVRVTADANSNSLIVTAPDKAMDLVEELIKQLDVLPDAETQIKVFELVHGDAQTVLGVLEALFTGGTQGAGGGGQQVNNLSNLPLQNATATDGATLVNIRFTYEPRSNAIIASGPAGDLQVVEALLNRLDARALNHMPPKVYRLSNAPAQDVADAINEYLTARNDIIENDPRTGGVTGINRSVIIQHEVVSNSLIVAALPEYLREIEDIIKALDRRPPMVKVKILIAEVDLDAVEEFGVELGIQDSLLFDRGTSIAPSGAITGIGFPFNSAANAANVPNANAFARELLAGQAVTQLGLGASNSGLGYSGFALSAGNESISVLMRALKDRQCVRILSKPHITTMENLQGRVAIGASVPRIAGVSQNTVGTQQDIVFQDVGVILEVTPRVSPDGMIILSVNAEKSSVGSAESGIVIGFSSEGDPITSPQILKTEATTTLMARSGQTVVFSGLIEETKAHVERGAPILSDLPYIGSLFKYESDTSSRRELMIIMTPTLVTSDQDIANQNQDEMDRMNWCLTDVSEVYGSTNFGGYTGAESAVETFYPDQDPTGLVPAVDSSPESSNSVQESRLRMPTQPRLSDIYEVDPAERASMPPTTIQTASEKPRRGIFSRRR